MAVAKQTPRTGKDFFRSFFIFKKRTRNIYYHSKRLWLQVAKIPNVLTIFDNEKLIKTGQL